MRLGPRRRPSHNGSGHRSAHGPCPSQCPKQYIDSQWTQKPGRFHLLTTQHRIHHPHGPWQALTTHHSHDRASKVWISRVSEGPVATPWRFLPVICCICRAKGPQHGQGLCIQSRLMGAWKLQAAHAGRHADLSCGNALQSPVTKPSVTGRHMKSSPPSPAVAS